MTAAAGERAARRVRELCAQIRAVNPTGRSLGAREERRRYEEKARLQSVLVEEHAALVRVRAHEDMPGIVSLSVPALEQSASHAVVADLSQRAQTWIASALVTDSESAPAAQPTLRRDRPRGGPEPAADDELLARALGHLRAFDYECAEVDLRALLETGTSAPATRERAMDALLEMLVDHLARDQDAIEAARRYEDVATSTRARLFLASAATRTGELPVALAQLIRVNGADARELLVSLTTKALEAREYAVALAGFQRWRTATADGPRSRPGPDVELEAKLSALLDRAPTEELEDDSLRELGAAVCPQHPRLVAREQLRRARREEEDYRRRRARLMTLRESTSSDDAGELRALVRAISSSPFAADDRALLDSVIAELDARELDAQLARVAALHDAGKLEEAALDLLRLSPEAQRRLRADPARTFFEDVAAIFAACGSVHGAARAAAAWTTARQGPAADAWARVAPFAALLLRVPGLQDALDAMMPRLTTAPTAGTVAAPSQAELASRSPYVHASLAPARTPVAGLRPLVAEETTLITGREAVVSLHRIGRRAHELWVDTIEPAHDGPSRSLTLRLSCARDWTPTAITTGERELSIVDDGGRTHVLSLGAAGSLSWSQGPLLDVIGGRSVMACAGGRALPVHRERVDSGAALQGATRPALVLARSSEVALFDGVDTRVVAVPAGLGEIVLVESPLGARRAPVILELTPPDLRVMVWWSAGAAEACWTGFRLREPMIPQAAVTLPGRGVLLYAWLPASALVVQKLVVRGARIERGELVTIAEGVSVVRDRAHRRVWAARVAANGERLQFQPLSLRATAGA